MYGGYPDDPTNTEPSAQAVWKTVRVVVSATQHAALPMAVKVESGLQSQPSPVIEISTIAPQLVWLDVKERSRTRIQVKKELSNWNLQDPTVSSYKYAMK